MVDQRLFQYPDLPPVGVPYCLFLGGHRGQWQYEAARRVQGVPSLHTYRTPIILLTAGVRLSLVEWETLVQSADRVVCWCGPGEDCWYLEEWIWVGYLYGMKKACLTSCALGLEHPMLAPVGLVPTTFDAFCDTIRRYLLT